MSRVCRSMLAAFVVIGFAWEPRPTVADEPKVEVAEHFKPFAFLVGSSWKGTFPNGKATDEHRFEWVYDGKFIRDKHVVAGGKSKYEGETIYAWDAAQKQIVFWYWASDGGFSQGSVKVDGKRFEFEEKHTGKKVQTIKTVWEKISDDELDNHAYRVGDDGELKELWTVHFRRQAEKK